MIFRDATLFQVTQSVTRNGKSIMLTMMLALILIYLFSLIGFMFFRDDFSTHIQKRFYPSYSSHRYRRSNATASQKTTTRRFFVVVRLSLSLIVFTNRTSFSWWKNSHFSSSFLATTIPNFVENAFCTKENCSDTNTLTNDIRSAAAARVHPTSSEEAEDEEVERSCDTLFMCIVTTLNKGLRNGGGIGDVLRQPSSQVRLINTSSIWRWFLWI